MHFLYERAWTVNRENLTSERSFCKWPYRNFLKPENWERHERSCGPFLLIRYLLTCLLFGTICLGTERFTRAVRAADRFAGSNSKQIQLALDQVPSEHRKGMLFLIEHMPDRDLKSLSAKFLLTNVRLAYQAWNETSWKSKIPETIFLSNVLPYANVTETREDWREDFYNWCIPMVKDATSPTQAAILLNQKLFSKLQVRYSKSRKRADQAPYESIKTGVASCTGLSILLINACRAVGVPARLVGIPEWSDQSGNHSWVEIWDDGWHFTGAAEPTGKYLNKAWFENRAAKAQRENRQHAIYAVSWQRTSVKFPLAWDPSVQDVYASNVTDRYVNRINRIVPGQVGVLFRVIDADTANRISVPLKIDSIAGKTLFEGHTKDEHFDTNDHLRVLLPTEEEYTVTIQVGKKTHVKKIHTAQKISLVTFHVDRIPKAKSNVVIDASPSAVAELRKYLAKNPSDRKEIRQQRFANVSLTRTDATTSARLLWRDHLAKIRRTRQAEMNARQLTKGDLKMPFYYRIFGQKRPNGRSMYISLHGGGGAPQRVNDQQWENQKKLYKLPEGVYVAPRAPTNTWDLWHQGHVDRFLDRLIENMIVFEHVDSNRIYIMGYSAGGDGVYQLAPRMGDRFAAAAMMAGHPNETSPLGLRNVPFTIHVGEKDAGYNRNRIARDWQRKLSDLRKSDPGGYVHWVKLYPDKGHWLDGEDAASITWMAKYQRVPIPKHIVWKQDNVVHRRFYWLANKRDTIQEGSEVIAKRDKQHFEIQANNVQGLMIRLNDQMLDLDQPITVTVNKMYTFKAKVKRSIALLSKTLEERGDRKAMYCAEINIDRYKN